MTWQIFIGHFRAFWFSALLAVLNDFSLVRGPICMKFLHTYFMVYGWGNRVSVFFFLCATEISAVKNEDFGHFLKWDFDGWYLCCLRVNQKSETRFSAYWQQEYVVQTRSLPQFWFFRNSCSKQKMAIFTKNGGHVIISDCVLF